LQIGTFSNPNDRITLDFIATTDPSLGIDEYSVFNNYYLFQNYPNPFNPSTTIQYSLTAPEKIAIRIYDVSGQIVKEINKEHNQAGKYEVIWDGTSDFGQKVSSGAYFYQLTVGNYTEAKKMILLR
jgi:nucleotidyltransferase/DNA polymerase involved in DNA repair